MIFPSARRRATLWSAPPASLMEVKPSIQATLQIVGGGNCDFGGRVGDIFWAQRQSRYMRMCIDKTRHQRSAANIDHVCIFMVHGRLRHRKYAVALDQDIERFLQLCEPVQNEV